MIAAVTTVFNEADIIGSTVQHLYAEGVDRIFAAVGPCDDNTRDICTELGVTVIDDKEPFHYQPRWMNRLANLAADMGHKWIVAFDADEFWYSNTGITLGATLRDQPSDVGVLGARMFQHRDWDWRHESPQPHGKVAYRWNPDAMIANGNHSITGVPGRFVRDAIDLRELHYRSFEHFQRKVRERVDRIDPSLPVTEGAHQRQYRELPEVEMRQAWDAIQQVPAVYDPVPSKFRP